MHRLFRAALVALLLSIPCSSPAGEIVAVGQPIPVTTPVTDYDWSAGATVGVSPANGSFVVVWSQQLQGVDGWGIWASRFDASGHAQGTVRVNPTATGTAEGAQIAFDGSGRFAIAWDASRSGESHLVWLRRFAANGDPATGEEPISAALSRWQQEPSLSMSPDGRLAVAWNDYDGRSVWAQVFDANGGRLLAGDLLVMTDGTSRWRTGWGPTVALTPSDNSFIVGWVSATGPSSELPPGPCGGGWQWGFDDVAQRFGADGEALGPQLTLNVPQPDGLRFPWFRIAPSGATSWLATWPLTVCPQASPKGFWGRVVSTDGTAGPPFQILGGFSGAIATDPTGHFVLIWKDASGTFARRYDGNGGPVTAAAPITSGGAVAADPSGNFVVAWMTATPEPNAPYPGAVTHQVFAQMYSVTSKHVTIDIKPGAYPNTINLGSNGVVKVAVLSDATFEAAQVDPTTVTLANAGVRLKGNGTPMSELRDVNGDGLVDLVVGVNTDALELTASDTIATLEGKTDTGLRITGEDTIRIVPK